MPGGNGTGPQGMGPMTGRAMGYCTGNSMPGYTNSGVGYNGCGFGRGRGRGMGGGAGRGFRNQFFATGLPGWARFGGAGAAGPVDEKQLLSNQADALRSQLDGIQNRLTQLEKSTGTKDSPTV